MAKKIGLYLVVLCLCVLMGACDAKDPENLLEMPQETAPVASTTKPVQPSAVTEPDIPVEEGYYQYGNMQKFPSSDFIFYDDEILFTWILDGRLLLYAYDLSTGEVSLLCKDATCTHGSNCLSHQVYANLEQYRGKLYAATKGSSMGKISELKDGQFVQIVDGEVAAFWHGNGNLYVETADQTLLAYENGRDTPRVLLEEYTERWNTVFGKYLYSGCGQGICRVDVTAENPQLEVLVEDSRGITDGRYIYYMDISEEYHLYRCNMDGSNPELLVDQPVFSGSLNFDDEYLYFRLYGGEEDLFGEGSNVLYRMPKTGAAEMEQLAELPESIQTVYTVPGYDLLFVYTINLDGIVDEYNPNAEYHLCVLNAGGSNITLLEIPEF